MTVVFDSPIFQLACQQMNELKVDMETRICIVVAKKKKQQHLFQEKISS